MRPSPFWRKPESILTLCVAFSSAAAWSQPYPTKPVRIITAEPGGTNDITARLVAPGLSASLGQQVLVDNRPAGVIPGQIVSKAPPDGHTLLVTTGLLWILPLIHASSPAELTAFMKADGARMSTVVKSAGIRAE